MQSSVACQAVVGYDLPGHGESDPPAGDYSLGAQAAALRDLLVALGHPPATIAGHSLGGGIGLQFAYQFPERTSRLILISSGGLGAELTPMLRGVTLRGAKVVVAGLGRLPEGLTRRLIPVLSLLPGLVARQDARRHQAIADHLQNAHLVEITGAGHYLHETAPDRLLPAIHAFLTSTTPFHYSETRWRDRLTQPSTLDTDLRVTLPSH